ncbi:MAG TPA: beta-ketoacyl synthase N-terminal-like domain-containing protein [Ktedonobacteraceae bacterium]
MQDANTHNFDLAITGMACRFPGADSLEAFWHNLCQGKETLAAFTEEELLAAGIEPATLRQPGYVKSRGTLSNVEQFDAGFFGYSPREAEIMDPQQRVFLECAWEAFEDANCDVQTYQGQIGVFAGSAMSSYLFANLYPVYQSSTLSNRAVMMGNEKDYLPARVSYKLNLSGPSMSVNTACSTSLVALHLACQSLLHGECDMALAGGISLAIPQVQGYVSEDDSHLSPDGHCRAFDAQAHGFVPSNGAGAVVLKRLANALADQDTIYAVIKSSAVNNDGAAKIGFTTPSVEGQMAVVNEALAMADCLAETISYVETHGSGTELGDSLEIAALTQAFRLNTSKNQFCAIGSVKPNIGHTGAASGIASLIKTVLALKYKQLPPSLFFDTPNPEIDFARSPFRVNTLLTPWQTGLTPRRAGVHASGNGGTNAHVILEEAPLPVAAMNVDERKAHLLVLSAKSASALEAQSQRLAAHLHAHPELTLNDVAYTLQTGRAALKHRLIVICDQREEAIQALRGKLPEQVTRGLAENADPPVIFVFPETAPDPGLGYQLYQSEPVYRKYIDECSHYIRSTLGIDIRDILYNTTGSQSVATLLRKASLASLILVMTEYALARLWMSWDVNPQAFIGSGTGEYVAACLAGVISLEDAFKLAFLRGQLAEEYGEMAGVSDGPRTPASSLEKYTTYLTPISFSPPHMPFFSSSTGTWITSAQATDPAYWAHQLTRPAQTYRAFAHLFTSQPGSTFLEVGPAAHSGAGQEDGASKSLPASLLPSWSRLLSRSSELASLLMTAGQLWCSGVMLNWSALTEGSLPRRVTLPTYPFERQRYWFDPRQPALLAAEAPDLASSSGSPDPVVDLAALQRYARPDLETPYVAPRNKIEQFIAELYQEFLGLDRVGVEDDFFEFGGGDSLVGTRVITRLKQAFQVRLSMRDIFEMPTVAELAQYIAKEISHE